MYAVTRLSFTFPKSKQLYAFFKKNDSHSYTKHYLFTKKCLLGLGLVKHLTFLYKKADFSVIVNILVKHYDAVLFKLLLHFYIFHFFQKSFFFSCSAWSVLLILFKDSNIFEFTNLSFKTNYNSAMVYSANSNYLYSRRKKEKKMSKQFFNEICCAFITTPPKLDYF